MEKIVTVVGVIVAFLVISILCAIPTYFLWNWLMPEIFGLKTITLFQALGLNLLSMILFKSHCSNSKG